jgi:hypothetical protein
MSWGLYSGTEKAEDGQPLRIGDLPHNGTILQPVEPVFIGCVFDFWRGIGNDAASPTKRVVVTLTDKPAVLRLGVWADLNMSPKVTGGTPPSRLTFTVVARPDQPAPPQPPTPQPPTPQPPTPQPPVPPVTPPPQPAAPYTPKSPPNLTSLPSPVSVTSTTELLAAVNAGARHVQVNTQFAIKLPKQFDFRGTVVGPGPQCRWNPLDLEEPDSEIANLAVYGRPGAFSLEVRRNAVLRNFAVCDGNPGDGVRISNDSSVRISSLTFGRTARYVVYIESGNNITFEDVYADNASSDTEALFRAHVTRTQVVRGAFIRRSFALTTIRTPPTGRSRKSSPRATTSRTSGAECSTATMAGRRLL